MKQSKWLKYVEPNKSLYKKLKGNKTHFAHAIIDAYPENAVFVFEDNLCVNGFEDTGENFLITQDCKYFITESGEFIILEQ